MTQIPVAAMLAALRRELRPAQAEALAAGDLRFLIEAAELELQVESRPPSVQSPKSWSRSLRTATWGDLRPSVT